MASEPNPILVFFFSFAISALSGIAVFLNSRRPLTTRALAATGLYNGLAGLGVSLCWYHYFASRGDVFFLLGFCIFLGLTGSFVVTNIYKTLFKPGGITLRISLDGLRPKLDDSDDEKLFGSSSEDQLPPTELFDNRGDMEVDE